MTVALYPNTFSKDFEIIDPMTAIIAIHDGKYADQITYLRTLGKNEYDIEKKKLPAVTWSGTFEPGTRKIETNTTYSSLVCLDVDGLDSSAIPTLLHQLMNDQYVWAAFTSPSNQGIKIIVKVSVTKAKDHRGAFLHLQHDFEARYPFKIDPSGKDVSRLCYVSYDPLAILKHSDVFEVDPKYGDIVTEHRQTADEMHATHDIKIKYDVCVKWVERNKTYRDGEKNIYIHALACAMNRVGIPQDTCIQLITANYQTPDTVWHQSVRSAYFHNQHEHGKISVREIGGTDFVPAPYVANFNDDVVINDLMRTTAMLFTHKVPNNEIIDYMKKLSRYYELLGYIDMNKNDLVGIMNYAVGVLNQNIANTASQHKLAYTTAEDMAPDLVKLDTSGLIPTYLPWFDEALGGGLYPANFYGLIGFGGTFKSIITEFWTFMCAMNDVPVLYLNAEMSKMQFYERLALMAFSQADKAFNLRAAISRGDLTEATVQSFMEQLEEKTKRNIFVFNGTNYSKQQILSTIDHIKVTTGKKVKLVIMDGLTQMDSLGREEAPANIHNSGICKEVAKEAHDGDGVTLVAIIHCSGEEVKTIRNTGSRVRGGSKLLANMDGYFSTSLLIDPEAISIENPDDIQFLPNKFYLRMTDKRSIAGIVSAIVNVDRKLHLSQEEGDPGIYEYNPKKQNQQYR